MSTVAPGDSAEVLSRRRDGNTTTLNGVFQERKPRPPGWGRPPWAGTGAGAGAGGPGGWGGPPPEPEDPDSLAARQYEELLTEQQQLAEAAEDVLALRQALVAIPAFESRGNWYLNETIEVTP